MTKQNRAVSSLFTSTAVLKRGAGSPRSRAGGGTAKRVWVLACLAWLAAGCNSEPQSQEQQQPQQQQQQQQQEGADVNKKPSIVESPFGTTSDGTRISLFTLTNSNGVQADIMTYGGIITSLKTPDKNDQFDDIVLGFNELEPYLKGTPYFGALIGRYGNRIDEGRFSIDGESYQLDTNHGPNHLHGGVVGFDKKVWEPTASTTESAAILELFLESPDGDQGYPGNLKVTATYTLTDRNELQVDFHAVTDKPTIVNLTQHSYFNLAGEGDILDHQLMIDAGKFTPVDSTLIPTGEPKDVAGTPFDFRQPTPIGARINQDNEQLEYGLGYDHNYVLDKDKTGAFELAARVIEPESGRVLEVWTDEPGIQFYSGNQLDSSLEGKGRVYSRYAGFCLEPQHFPDSPNRPDFPSTVLRPGEEYSMRMSFKFGVVDG